MKCKWKKCSNVVVITRTNGTPKVYCSKVCGTRAAADAWYQRNKPPARIPKPKKPKKPLINQEPIHGEVWRESVNYPGFYMVSNKGRVKVDPDIYSKSPATNNYTPGYILKKMSSGNGRGYKKFSASPLARKTFPGSPVSPLIHREVALAFIPNPEDKLEVNHKNGVKHDNSLENLEWVTQQENLDHARDNGLIGGYCYTKNKTSLVMEFEFLSCAEPVTEDEFYSLITEALKDTELVVSGKRILV